jgi:SAM-dependent methyltransferase
MSDGNSDARERFTGARVAFWDLVARENRSPRPAARYYYRRLAQTYRFLCSPGLRVLEVGCGKGDLLAALEPAHGVGVDSSSEMIRAARKRHPNLTFVQADAGDMSVTGPFDVAILSDVLGEVWDVQRVLERVSAVLHPRSRVIINCFSRLWEVPLRMAGRAGLCNVQLQQNWLTLEDLQNLLYLAGLEVVKTWQEVLCPVGIPLLAGLCNRFLAKLPFFRALALTHFIVARPQPGTADGSDDLSVSVVIPARNEAGSIPRVFQEMPRFGSDIELVFVEGHSKDDTFEAIERSVAANPHWSCQVHRQPGVGKGDAVRMGFRHAKGEVLMILDADLTVAPEDLPRFYEALVSGKGDFINGVRLVYPMEVEAMRFVNMVGNKFFSLAFSWLLGQPIKDTLCGTKVLRRSDYDRIAANRGHFGKLDPFGDFDLIFGAAKQGMKIADMPIRYRRRTYGVPNIQRWKHGWLLLRMAWLAARKIKFV